MNYGSVCSGIEAASVAWEPLGWNPLFFSEIEKFPSAVLSCRYPSVPNLGDFTKINDGDYNGTIELLVGGTPCQDYSISGRRAGMDGARGKLTREYINLAKRLRPRWVVWENVPGILSSNGVSDFGAFIRDLGECGYGFAYRILDLQYVRVQQGFPCGIPQRRRRLFVVGYSGDWRPPAAVLFDKEFCEGGSPPLRRKGCVSSSAVGDSSIALGETIGALLSRDYKGLGNQDLSTGRGLVLSFENHANDSRISGPNKVCSTITQRWGTGGNNQDILLHNLRIRKLTPVECERLFGFQDNWTQIPWQGRPAEKCPDSHRYKALGNSMGVNVMRWIGIRIYMVDKIKQEGLVK